MRFWAREGRYVYTVFVVLLLVLLLRLLGGRVWGAAGGCFGIRVAEEFGWDCAEVGELS